MQRAGARIGRLLHAWGYIGAVIGGVAVAGLGQYIARDSSGWAERVWIGVSIAGLAVAGVTPVVQKLRQDSNEKTIAARLIDAKAELRVAMNDALDPCVEELGKVAGADAAQRSGAVERLVTLALLAATKTIESDRTRACFFKVDQGPPASVVPALHAGRHGRPRTTFTAGSRAGNAVIKMLEEDRHLFCRDVRTKPPVGWNSKAERDYRTFISVPARADDSVVGMLSVDAPEPGDLSEDDVPFLRVLGSIIAVGINLRKLA